MAEAGGAAERNVYMIPHHLESKVCCDAAGEDCVAEAGGVAEAGE